MTFPDPESGTEVQLAVLDLVYIFRKLCSTAAYVKTYAGSKVSAYLHYRHFYFLFSVFRTDVRSRLLSLYLFVVDNLVQILLGLEELDCLDLVKSRNRSDVSPRSFGNAFRCVVDDGSDEAVQGRWGHFYLQT